MKKIILSSLCLVFLSLNLFTQDLVTDRPDQTESSTVVPKAKLQWESGFLWESLIADYPNNDKFNNRVLGINSSLFRYGLMEKFELRFGWDYVHTVTRVKSGNEIIYEEKSNELEPVYFGGKYTLMRENGALPEVAILGHIAFPSVNIVEDSEQIQPDITLAGSWTFSSASVAGLNLGLHWPGFGKGDPSLFYSVVLGLAHGKKLSSFWELYGFWYGTTDDLVYYEAGFSVNDFRADFGITYLLFPNLQLDLSGGLGFSKISPDFFVATGFSWRIPR